MFWAKMGAGATIPAGEALGALRPAIIINAAAPPMQSRPSLLVWGLADGVMSMTG